MPPASDLSPRRFCRDCDKLFVLATLDRNDGLRCARCFDRWLGLSTETGGAYPAELPASRVLVRWKRHRERRLHVTREEAKEPVTDSESTESEESDYVASDTMSDEDDGSVDGSDGPESASDTEDVALEVAERKKSDSENSDADADDDEVDAGNDNDNADADLDSDAMIVAVRHRRPRIVDLTVANGRVRFEFD